MIDISAFGFYLVPRRDSMTGAFRLSGYVIARNACRQLQERDAAQQSTTQRNACR